MKRFLILICVWLTMLPNGYADFRLTISSIKEISKAVQNADQDTLVVFDVDNVISAPSDLIGRPKARAVKRTIFKEYEKKYGKDRVVHIHSLYYLRTREECVEKEVKDIILGLYARKIPSIALTAIGTGKFGNIDDPMHLRVSRLKEKGIVFAFENLKKRILWDDEAGFESGVIFSGKQSKGEALQYFLENIAQWKPKHVIFVDDNLECLKSVSEMCNKLKIKFTGFHYKSAVFDEDQELSLKVARLQLKTLDEQRMWIPDEEAYKQIEDIETKKTLHTGHTPTDDGGSVFNGSIRPNQIPEDWKGRPLKQGKGWCWYSPYSDLDAVFLYEETNSVIAVKDGVCLDRNANPIPGSSMPND